MNLGLYAGKGGVMKRFVLWLYDRELEEWHKVKGVDVDYDRCVEFVLFDGVRIEDTRVEEDWEEHPRWS